MMFRLALVTLILFGASAPAATAGPLDRRCGTPALLRSGPIPALATNIPSRAAAGPKLIREGFTGSFQQHLSANFAIKWMDASVTVAQAQIVAGALELAWAKYIDELGHAPCTGCETFRLNAYISREQDNPSINFAGGYAYLDGEGYPYFVISRTIFAGPEAEATIKAVAVHEFYHDIQFSTGAFAWGATDYGWFWEATAEWAAQEALPTASDPYVYSGAFAVKSELPLYHYGDPFGADPVEGVHQYGAAIFFRHLTDKLDAPSVVVNAWEQSGASDEPLAAVSAQLPSSDLVTLHTEFAARNAIWDYPHRQFIIDSLGFYKGVFPGETEISASVPPQGVGMTALARSPYGFGYSTIELRRPPTGRFRIDVQMAPTPPIPAELHGTVVYGEPGAATYTPLEITGATGSVTMNVPDTAVRLYLVLSTTTAERLTGRAIPLSYQVTPVEAVDDEDGMEVGGCCETGSSPAGSVVAFAGVLLVLRRRRR